MSTRADSIEMMKIRKQQHYRPQGPAISHTALAVKFGFGLALVTMLVVGIILGFIPAAKAPIFASFTYAELIQSVMGVICGAAMIFYRLFEM